MPHATAGLAIIETGAGSDDDLLAALGDLLPADDRWRHRHGSPGHGRSHVMPAIVPPHCTVPVLAGRLALGTWQSICLVDLNVDNDRPRGPLVLPRGLSGGPWHAPPTRSGVAPLPGDDLVRADVVMDRGFDLPAPPDEVWPWLVQLGKRRAGWYLRRPRSSGSCRRRDERCGASSPGGWSTRSAT